MSFHEYDIQEIFSNADGTIQFIELKIPTADEKDGEHEFEGRFIRMNGGVSFTFPEDLPSSDTDHRHVLIATAGFEAVAGFAPDYVIPDGFLPIFNGGTLNFGNGADTAAWTNQLPLDGETSLFFDINNDDAKSTGDNSPTNFAGQTTHIDVESNFVPVVAAPIANKVTGVGQELSFAFGADTFTDADDDPLTYTATLANDAALPDWLDFDAETRTFSGTPTSGDVATISVKVTADDGKDHEVSDTFTIRVISGEVLTGTASGETLDGTTLQDSISGADGADVLNGLAGRDTLKGGMGGDTLVGGGGVDKLNGGTGADTFRFTQVSSDQILDFQGGIDCVELDNAFFKKFATEGAIASTRIQVGTATQVTNTSGDRNDFLKYETNTGNLYYDPDGFGPGALKLIAVIDSSGAAFDPRDDVFVT